MLSGEHILRKGNSESLAILAASAVLPLLGGPISEHIRHISTLTRRAGQGRTGQDRTGQDRTGQDRTGQNRTE